LEIAERIRREVREEVGITVSIGVSFNKVFAKLGSDYKKPDAITVINEENFRQIAFPLPACDLLFVGKKTAEQLSSMGIKTVGQLASVNPETLKRRFGKMGEMLYKYANGLDDSPVSSEREDAKSVGSGMTFRHDLIDPEECKVGIEYLADDVARRLRRSGMLCETVQLTVKDEFLRVLQRQRPQNPPSDIAKQIAETAYLILLDEWQRGKPIRMLTVTASNLVRASSYAEQIDIFGEEDYEERKKSKKREETIDTIRAKFGSTSIIQGSVMTSDTGVFKKKGD
jgi:DNA polymerase-4